MSKFRNDKKKTTTTRSSNTSSSSNTPISGHIKKGSVLVPPLAAIPTLRLASWIDDRLPEMLWAALILIEFPQHEALTVFARGINYLRDLRQQRQGENGEEDFKLEGEVTHSGLSDMAPEASTNFVLEIASNARCRRALRPLLLLRELPIGDTWKNAIEDEPLVDDWATLASAVATVFDNQSQEATDCRFARIMGLAALGALHLPESMVKEFLAYPDGVEMQKVRPMIRAAEGGLAALFESQKKTWPSTFWAQCLTDTNCYRLPVEFLAQEKASTPSRPLIGTTPAQVGKVRDLLVSHCNATRVTSAVDARHDTVFGTALYCISILSEVLRLGVGNGIMARMGLRTLVDNLITLAYLAKKNDPQLWQSYRVFGSGQAKLQYLKLEADPQTPGYVDAKTLKELANEDRWEEFLQIDLGHWDKSNTRVMSEEAGVKSFYDRFYGWTSAFSHGHWGPVRNTVFDTCGNPLHRLHRIPRELPSPLPDVVPDAATCMDEILNIVAQSYPSFPHRVGVAAPVPSTGSE